VCNGQVPQQQSFTSYVACEAAFYTASVEGFQSKQMSLSCFGSIQYLHHSTFEVVEQYNRGVVRHEKVVEESYCKVSPARLGESICTRGETRISMFCLVRVSHHCTDRYVGTEPVSRHTDMESQGVAAVPVATTEIDSFKQASYGCTSTLQ